CRFCAKLWRRKHPALPRLTFEFSESGGHRPHGLRCAAPCVSTVGSPASVMGRPATGGARRIAVLTAAANRRRVVVQPHGQPDTLASHVDFYDFHLDGLANPNDVSRIFHE